MLDIQFILLISVEWSCPAGGILFVWAVEVLARKRFSLSSSHGFACQEIGSFGGRTCLETLIQMCMLFDDPNYVVGDCLPSKKYFRAKHAWC